MYFVRPDPDGLRHQLEVMVFYYVTASIAGIFIAVSSWVFATRMRRRIKDDLGKAADAGDLTSVETWMKVDEVEEKKHPGQAWAPESSDVSSDPGGLLDPPKSMPELDRGAGPDRGAMIDFLPEDKRK